MSQDVTLNKFNKIYSCRKDVRNSRQGVYESTSGDDLGRVESGPSQMWACMMDRWQVAAMHAIAESNPEKEPGNRAGESVNRWVRGKSREFASGRAPSICIPVWGVPWFRSSSVQESLGVPCVWYAQVLEKS